MFGDWDAIRSWAAEQTTGDAGPDVDAGKLGAPVPIPTQVFAIGLNYRDHAEEATLPIPNSPMVFTKFPSCLVGPDAEVPLTSDRVDWEVEQVVVIGREASRVPAARPGTTWPDSAGPGHLGPAAPVRRQAAAVQSRKVGDRIRPAGPGARQSRRVRESRCARAALLGRR